MNALDVTTYSVETSSSSLRIEFFIYDSQNTLVMTGKNAISERMEGYLMAGYAVGVLGGVIFIPFLLLFLLLFLNLWEIFGISPASPLAPVLILVSAVVWGVGYTLLFNRLGNRSRFTLLFHDPVGTFIGRIRGTGGLWLMSRWEVSDSEGTIQATITSSRRDWYQESEPPDSAAFSGLFAVLLHLSSKLVFETKKTTLRWGFSSR